MKPHNIERMQTMREAIKWAESIIGLQAEELHEEKKHADVKLNDNVVDLSWKTCHTLRCESARRTVAGLEEVRSR